MIFLRKKINYVVLFFIAMAMFLFLYGLAIDQVEEGLQAALAALTLSFVIFMLSSICSDLFKS